MRLLDASIVTEAYYTDDFVTLYHGDYRDVLPTVDVQGRADLVIADPPYGETSLEWDSWPDSWPGAMLHMAQSMWSFGSMRMFLDRRHEFDGWKLSQDIVWEKHNGAGFQADRFKRVHEHALHWYQGDWSAVHHDTPTTMDATARTVKRRGQTPHMGKIGSVVDYATTDGGPRLARSVLFARSMNGFAINETEKPVGLLEPLVSYGCPPGELVLDPFAGSCSTLIAARNLGRRAIGIEKRESQCEAAANRLAQSVFDFGVTS